MHRMPLTHFTTRPGSALEPRRASHTGTVTRVAVALVAVGLLAGCATTSSLSGSSYERRQVRTEQTVRIGVVESVREVEIEAGEAVVGTATGAVVGGVAGSTIGGGRGQVLSTVIGAVAGGIAGNLAEKGIRRERGVEITVRLRNGDLIAVTQAADPREEFRAGDEVRVLSGGGVTRVTR